MAVVMVVVMVTAVGISCTDWVIISVMAGWMAGWTACLGCTELAYWSGDMLRLW